MQSLFIRAIDKKSKTKNRERDYSLKSYVISRSKVLIRGELCLGPVAQIGVL